MPPTNHDDGSPSKLTRRKFLGTGIVASAASISLPAFARSGAAVSPRVDDVPSFELDEITIAALQDGMKSGKFTARSIAQKYLDRIAQIDKAGPALNSIIELNPNALSIADALDAERKSKGPRGPMHGIPVLIKDNIGTADKMMTTAGSLALSGFTPTKDSGVARKLREAGTVILGKTNLSEWANFRSSHSVSGWSGRGGLTRNPYALDRNACGSSSGSGAAASANLAAVTVGTETDGSIVCPSSANGVVGMKPTVGLLSRAGIIPISHTQDTPGPICRTVTDAAILLGAMAGIDPDDAATAASRGKSHTDYTKFLNPAALRGARIGVVRKLFGFIEALDPFMNDTLAMMKSGGAVLVDPVEIASLGKFDGSETTVLQYEFKADLNKYLAEFSAYAPVHSLKEVIAFNESHRDQEMPYFGQDIMEKCEAHGPLTDKAYLDALAKNHRLARAEGIDAVMDQHRLDALVAPTAAPSWVTDLIDGDHDTGGSSSPAAVAGYPNINAPAGFIFGMPVGISFFGRAWSEPKLIAIAFAFEQATHHRQAPKFLPTANLQPAM
ncbi:MAG TPA: amidase [Candidatus Acidoferrales bacterium]|nr:amidase [Candidatus Acidoferrales bacterium]